MRLFTLIVLISFLLAGCSDSGSDDDPIPPLPAGLEIPSSMVGEFCYETETNDGYIFRICGSFKNLSYYRNDVFEPTATFWNSITLISTGASACANLGWGIIEKDEFGFFANHDLVNKDMESKGIFIRRLSSVSSNIVSVRWDEDVNYTFYRRDLPTECEY